MVEMIQKQIEKLSKAKERKLQKMGPMVPPPIRAGVAAFYDRKIQELTDQVSVERAMRASSELREKCVMFTDPPEDEYEDRTRKQFCLSCGATHYQDICPECGSDAQDDL